MAKNSGAGYRPGAMVENSGSTIGTGKILFGSGLLSTGRPDRVVKRLVALSTFGPTLAGSFAAAAARDPDRVAIIDDDRRLTNGEFDQRIRRITAGLAALGARPGKKGGVATYMRNSAYAVEGMVAASRAGANSLLLNTFMSAQQVTDVLFRERPAVLIADAELAFGLDVIPENTQLVIAHHDGFDHDLLTLDDLAHSVAKELKPPDKPGRIVILTSGTTGTPKGARRGHTKGLGPAASLLSIIGLKAPETMLFGPPVFHTLSLGFLQLAPALNSTIVLVRKPDAQTLVEAITKHRCTSAVIVPVMAQRMTDLPEEVLAAADTTSLQTVVCSSAALPPDVCERFQDMYGDVLYNLYGSTEVSWATIASPADLRAMPGTAGRPPVGTRLALLDDDDRLVARGEPGRIFVGNGMMFEGYTNGQDRNRVAGMMATGDMGTMTDDGLLMVLGRDDDMVVIGGENVYPSEVENFLEARPEVKEVAVVGVDDDAFGQRLAAYVVLHEGASVSEDEIKNLVRGALSRPAVPRDVVFLEVLPRNAVGKVIPRMLTSEVVS